MSTGENKALARRFIQGWVPGNLGLVDELAAPDITVSHPMLSEPVHGAVALKQILAHSHVGIPDLRVDVEEQIAEGNNVAVRWRVTGTSRGVHGHPADRQIDNLDWDYLLPLQRRQSGGGAR